MASHGRHNPAETENRVGVGNGEGFVMLGRPWSSFPQETLTDDLALSVIISRSIHGDANDVTFFF